MNHELQKFLAIVETGSFTRAAEQLRISQPALTLAIKNLERQIGAQLLIRGGGKISLTEAGKTVYDSARYIRLELDNLNQRLTDKAGRIQKQLRIGMIDSIGDLIFSSHNPITVEQLDLTVDNSQQLIEDVLLDRVDMAFVTRQLKIEADELKFSRLGKEPFLLVVHPEHEAKTRSDLRKNVLRNMQAYNEQSNTFGLMSRTMRGHGIRLQPTTFSTDPGLLRSLALAGRGPTMLPMRIVVQDVEKGDLIALPYQFSREIQVAYRSGKYLSVELQNIRNSVQEHLYQESELAQTYYGNSSG